MPNESLDRLETLAKIGSSLAGVQFEAASIASGDVADDLWVFGYCFGLLDAMAQYAGLDQYTEAAQMMSNALGKLVGDETRGLDMFGQAIDRQSDPHFAGGFEVGSADLLAWADDANCLPTGLAKHLGSRARQ